MPTGSRTLIHSRHDRDFVSHVGRPKPTVQVSGARQCLHTRPIWRSHNLIRPARIATLICDMILVQLCLSSTDQTPIAGRDLNVSPPPPSCIIFPTPKSTELSRAPGEIAPQHGFAISVVRFDVISVNGRIPIGGSSDTKLQDAGGMARRKVGERRSPNEPLTQSKTPPSQFLANLQKRHNFYCRTTRPRRNPALPPVTSRSP
jgi:hypothetical protein